MAATIPCYVAEVPSFTRVWIEDPAVCHGAGVRRPSNGIQAKFVRRVDKLATSLPEEAWTTIKVCEGTKRPLTFQFARVRI
jgi:hypothetical protein